MTTTRILLGVTGSVAAVKSPEIALCLVQQYDAHVKVLLSRGGRNFWDQSKNYNPDIWKRFEECLEQESKRDEPRLIVIDSSDEWRQWQQLGDPVMHIDLRNWADLLLVAPLSAHSLAKFRHGLCDDVLSSVVRAWKFTSSSSSSTSAQQESSSPSASLAKPVLLAPAMNTAMWEHVLTRAHLTAIQGFATTTTTTTATTNSNHQSGGVVVIEPMVKSLACGEVGNGALAPVSDILSVVQATIERLVAKK